MAKIDLHAIAHSYNPTSNVPLRTTEMPSSWRDGGRYASGPSGCGKTTLLISCRVSSNQLKDT